MVYVGLDLGQKRDHTAIAVLEATQWKERIVRHAERVMLGTPWSRVVERVREIVRHPRMGGDCALAVDATGIGAPVVESLRAAGLGCEIAAVTITGGERETRTADGFHVPKKDLMAGLRLGLENGDIMIAKHMREAKALVRELIDIKAQGNRIGAEGANRHDDLVIAVALAVWRANQPKPKPIMFHATRLI